MGQSFRYVFMIVDQFLCKKEQRAPADLSLQLLITICNLCMLALSQY